jgi:hypothetical protein
MMDSDDEMMLLFMQEEENATAYQEEHFTTSPPFCKCKPTICAMSLPFVEVQNLGEERAKKVRGWRVMPYYTPIILPTMHRLPKRNFSADLG